jgi:O-antigen/teichoic acid export membrane protein
VRIRLNLGRTGVFAGENGTATRSIVGNGARLMGVQGIETALNAAYFAIIARCLGPALYGQWAYGIAAYLLVIGLLGFGIDPLIMLRVGRDRDGAAEFVGLMLTLRLALLGLGAAVLMAYALVAEPDPLGRLLLLLLWPAVFGRGAALTTRVCFLAYEHMRDYAAYAALFRCAEAACGIAYLLAGGGLVGIVVLHGACWIAEAAFGLLLIRSRLAHYALRLSWRPARAVLGDGAILGLGTAAATWLSAGPILILRHTSLGIAQLGQFAIVSSLTMILAGSAQAFFAAALPVLSRTALPADAGLTYGRRAALAIAAAAIIAAAGAWALGPPVVTVVLGAGYATAGGLLAPFGLIGGAILAPTAYSQMLLVSGRRWPVALADLAAALCLGVTLAPAATAGGLDAAVLATGTAWLVRAGVLIGWAEAQGARLACGHADMRKGMDGLALLAQQALNEGKRPVTTTCSKAARYADAEKVDLKAISNGPNIGGAGA